MDGRKIVLRLLMDDGVPSRGHRHNIFNKDYDCMGSFTGPNKAFKYMTAVNYCVGWRPKGSKDPVKAAMKEL